MKRSLLTGLAAAAAISVTLAGCGSNSLSNTPSAASTALPTVSVNSALASKVPDKIKTAGVIQIGTDATYAPNEYMSGTDVIGFDVDLFNAVAAELGLKTKWNPAGFDTILIGVKAGKYDVGVSSFTVNTDRLAEVTMVQYANVGVQWATLVGNPKKVDITNPCGHTIAVQTGTVEDDEMKAAEEKCGAGKIEVLRYTGQDEVNNALISGKADAMLADYPITQYAIKTAAGKTEALGDQYGAAPYGYAMTKENQALAEAISGALADLKKSGFYDAVLAKYGIGAAAVSTFDINPKVS